MADRIATLVDDLSSAAQAVRLADGLRPRGVVRRVGDGVAVVAGMDHARYEELLAFDSGAFGLAFDLRQDELGVVLLAGAMQVGEGDGVIGTRRLPELPVGPETLGRVFDPLGNRLDEGPSLSGVLRLPLFRPAPEIIDRRSVTQPLLTGVMAVDAAIPIGRGQRELIVGDRNVGKTALAIDFVAAQRPDDVIGVYVLIGQPMSRVHALREDLERAGCLGNTAIVAALASDSPGLRYLAPFAGAAVAEWFRDQGRHALVVYDDLTKHADAYRELALLLDRPPGREAYPGDIFYLHAELLERAAALRDERGGGTVTAFPIVETTDGDISAYIPTNLISITDGQIYLDTGRFERGLRPAIDVSRSVSRIGAHAQPPAMRWAAKNLKIQISRFESLEKLSRVGFDLDVATQATLRMGQTLRESLRQGRLRQRGLTEQVITLLAISHDWLGEMPPKKAIEVIVELERLARRECPVIVGVLDRGELPEGAWQDRLEQLVARAQAES